MYTRSRVTGASQHKRGFRVRRIERQFDTLFSLGSQYTLLYYYSIPPKERL
jgi:hypothetical protein